MTGSGRIYSFPFCIYGIDGFQALEGTSGDRRFRIRVHPPFEAREGGTRLSPAVPFEMWPSFAWSPESHPEDRLAPPTLGIGLPGLGNRAYDAMRLDVWGDADAAHEYVLGFVPAFLAWVRHLSGQEWIGEFEPHNDTWIKAAFRIDESGDALDAPYALGVSITPSAYARAVTFPIWRESFSRALSAQSVPVFWSVYQDARVFQVQGKLRETVLALALSLETCRDSVFPRFAKTRSRPGLGAVLAKPFEGTDLLVHVTTALEQVRGRNLRREHAQLYAEVDRLYIARHHVAHGRNPLTRSAAGKMHKVEEADVRGWQDGVYGVIRWMEEL